MSNINSTEDFTFPTFTDIFSISAIDSPPLWHLSPEHRRTQSYHGNEESDDDQDEDYKDCFATIPSISVPCEEKLANSSSSESNAECEGEKMDMLWEDFNEELMMKSYSSRMEMVNMGCIQALRMSSNRTGGAVVAPPRKPSAGFLVLIKVLRKLFLIHHNSHRSVKNHNSRSHVKKT